jgi:hypothetical protein
VRNIPEDSDETVSEHVQHFFAVNHRDHYLSHQVLLLNRICILQLVKSFACLPVQAPVVPEVSFLSFLC